MRRSAKPSRSLIGVSVSSLTLASGGAEKRGAAKVRWTNLEHNEHGLELKFDPHTTRPEHSEPRLDMIRQFPGLAAGGCSYRVYPTLETPETLRPDILTRPTLLRASTPRSTQPSILSGS